MDVVFDRVAGLDIGKASVTVCVRTPGPGGNGEVQTRTFRTMTRSLTLMADWLEECGVELAAMGSTATYWNPVFYCLEEQMERWPAERRAHEGRACAEDRREGRRVDRPAPRARGWYGPRSSPHRRSASSGK